MAPIMVNYEDLTSSHPGSEGASATVGIKDVGPQGANRCWLPSMTDRIAGSAAGKSIRIGKGISDPAAITPDYYAFTLGGRSTGGACADRNRRPDRSGDFGRTAKPPARCIDGSRERGSGVLFGGGDCRTVLREVTGNTRSDYHLLVVRDGTFDLETTAARTLGGRLFQPLALTLMIR